MESKRLNMSNNSLSEKLVGNGDKPFRLWLEFEETSPWDDIENDFAHILVDTLDGRSYGIKVWTFRFMETARQQEASQGNTSYMVPPDLFVKELSRACIEKVISQLINNGELEDQLNPSVFGLKFIDPYWDASDMSEDMIAALEHELHLELPDNHILKNQSLHLLARKSFNDDIVVGLDHGRIAVVHLTWKSKKEVDGFPITRVYTDEKEFWLQEMKQDIEEYQ